MAVDKKKQFSASERRLRVGTNVAVAIVLVAGIVVIVQVIALSMMAY